MEMTTKSSRDDMSNEKETWLFRVFFGDEILYALLPSYVGITINYYRNPY